MNNEHCYGSKLDNAIHTTVIELLSLEQFCVCSEKWVTWCAGDRLQQMEEERMASGAILHLSTPLVEGAELLGSDWRESDSSKNIYTLVDVCYDKCEWVVPARLFCIIGSMCVVKNSDQNKWQIKNWLKYAPP